MTNSKISEIRPYLYLTGYMCFDEQTLKDHGITHAVDVTNMPWVEKYPGIEYFYIKVDDNEHANLKSYFESAANFIHSAVYAAQEEAGKVIVYCAAGVSRSSSIVITYLLTHESFSLKDAYYEVVSKRPIISPNLGFWSQMIEYEKEKNGESTVTLLPRKIIAGKRMAIPDVYLNRRKEIKEQAKAKKNLTSES